VGTAADGGGGAGGVPATVTVTGAEAALPAAAGGSAPSWPPVLPVLPWASLVVADGGGAGGSAAAPPAAAGGSAPSWPPVLPVLPWASLVVADGGGAGGSAAAPTDAGRAFANQGGGMAGRRRLRRCWSPPLRRPRLPRAWRTASAGREARERSTESCPGRDEHERRFTMLPCSARGGGGAGEGGGGQRHVGRRGTCAEGGWRGDARTSRHGVVTPRGHGSACRR
jgi:hypothetical protein